MRAVLVIVLIVIVVALIGAWRNWWGISVSENEAENQSEMKVVVDKDEIQEDARAVVDSTREASEAVSVAAGVESVRGHIAEIDEESITLTGEDGDSETFTLSTAAEYVAEGEAAGPEEFNQGDEVVITYRESDGKKSVLKVTLLMDEPATQPQS
jgi:hypothetical protein